jgi:tetratricopeptide (TPR) repeat protein
MAMHRATIGGNRFIAMGVRLAALAIWLIAGGAAQAQPSEPKAIEFEGPELPVLSAEYDHDLIVVSDEEDSPPAPPDASSPPAPSASAERPEATGAELRFESPGAPAPVVDIGDAPIEAATGAPAPHEADQPPDLFAVPEPRSSGGGPYPEDEPTPAQPASFQGLQPGRATFADARAALGEPKTVQGRNDAAMTAVFAVEAFDEVRMLFNREVISSIVIDMGQPLDPQSLLIQLGLDQFEPVVIRDDAGRPLGVAVPDRGVLLTLTTNGAAASVKQVVLESLDAQAFLARAQSDLFGPLTWNLRDLAKAIELSPADATAHALRSELLLRVGRADDALAAAAQAVELDGGQPRYRLAFARALAAVDRYEQALRETEQVLESLELPPVVRAEGFAQLGDLLLEGPRRDVAEALKLHQAALKLAIPIAADADSPDRQAAAGVVIGAHLSVAQDISLGGWRNKPQAIDGWTRRAAEFAQKAIQQGDAGADAVLSVSRASLAAHSALRGATDGSSWLADAVRAGETLLADQSDPLKEADIRWQLAVCHFHALQIAHARGEITRAEELGQAAVQQMHELAKIRDLSAPQQHLLGRLFFQIGAVYAVHQQDHREAARWYDKSVELLKTPVAVNLLTQPSDDGEAMISMGVTFWELNRPNEAIAWTEQGAALVAESVRAGATPEGSLAVPYGNLANMHRQMGDTAQAHNYAELAARPAAVSRQ